MRRFLFGLVLLLGLAGAAQAQVVISVTNAGTTGTTNGSLAKLTGAPSTAVIAATTDTNGIIGVVVSGGGTTGSALIARSGQASCTFDGATTAGDWVIASSTTGGDCHDTGSATYPTTANVQVLGRVLSTNASGGSYAMTIAAPDSQITSGGGGSTFGAYPVANTWYLAALPLGSTVGTNAAQSTTTTVCTPFIVRTTFTTSNIGINISTPGSSNIQLAIYNSGTTNRPNAVVGHTANIANNAGGQASGALSVQLTAGLYWACIQANDTTMLSSGFTATGTTVPAMIGSATFTNVTSGGFYLMGVTISSTFGTWPTGTWSDLVPNATNAIPMIAYEVASVP